MARTHLDKTKLEFLDTIDKITHRLLEIRQGYALSQPPAQCLQTYMAEFCRRLKRS